MKMWFVFSCLMLSYHVDAYEYVYCEELKTGDWQWLLDDEQNYVWVSGYIVRYRCDKGDNPYDFGSMQVSYGLFVKLHTLCEKAFGAGWVPHPGDYLTDWYLFDYVNSMHERVFSSGFFTPQRVRYSKGVTLIKN